MTDVNGMGNNKQVAANFNGMGGNNDYTQFSIAMMCDNNEARITAQVGGNNLSMNLRFYRNNQPSP